MHYTVRESDRFSLWLDRLKDVKGKVAILRRINRIKQGNFGDHKRIDTDVWELRLMQGPGYRIYYTVHRQQVVLLLLGGDKSSQQNDIKQAKIILKEGYDEKQ